ncbi:hypothetical protein IM543_05400 [Massilia sp. UMI-21]|nr:hypothetical protein IM543_05400 [Massilia sp. UMI-21]
MNLAAKDFHAIRSAIAEIPADVSNDAVGAYVPKLADIYAPETHAAALDPSTPIVVGSRGAGKSFWSGVLGQELTRQAAAKAYPRLGLEKTFVEFGFTGVGGPEGIGVDALNGYVPHNADIEVARTFWWATILRAVEHALNGVKPKLSKLMDVARDWETREETLFEHEKMLRKSDRKLLIVFDALDTMATSWSRRRMLTEALLEVVWGMRAYRGIKPKLFLRPDQIDDDGLRFVELPKLRTGAVRLNWTRRDLYGLLFSRVARSTEPSASQAFRKILKSEGIPTGTADAILTRRWPLLLDEELQARLMERLAGAYMADGPYGYKKGKTYDWPVVHLADAFDEVTPRSFLGLMISAAKFGPAPDDRAVTPDGIRHGLRAASKTRVDQLHQEFPWIKGVLAPLSGLLLPQDEKEVFRAWRVAHTVQELLTDAGINNYLPPFPTEAKSNERDLFQALERIGVMFRRRDERVDMPDLFRVAAKLLKKGGTAPV